MTANFQSEHLDYFLDIYGQVDFLPIYGHESRLYDINNNMVIDFSAGIAVNSLGHAHPALIGALVEQANKLWHCSNIMLNQPALELAKLLVEKSCFDKVFFCNSGTEANEAALKLARRYAFKNFNKKNKIVSFKNSFHGRTLFAVSVGGQTKYSQDFAPLPSGIEHGIFNDINSAISLINDETAAVIVEPIQAEGGVIPADINFLKKLRELCDEHKAILIFDEVQTGLGRTGKLFAYEHYGVEPDIISLAKALGCGFPIGAILVKEKFANGFEIGSHGTTFGGNPLACSVALIAFKIISNPEFLTQVLNKSTVFFNIINEINNDLQIYDDIRGIGLLIGAELKDEYKNKARDLMNLGFKYGVATLTATADVTRFTPPLIINHIDINYGFERFYNAIKELKNS
ncbi:MAG: acetylornithine/succinyldiaminopimelate transaminase [Burkholderiales bacterium]|nr:acetylornithine/succinyldiaminopimelate transaminase [Burkholderiales bacterium]